MGSPLPVVPKVHCLALADEGGRAEEAGETTTRRERRASERTNASEAREGKRIRASERANETAGQTEDGGELTS